MKSLASEAIFSRGGGKTNKQKYEQIPTSEDGHRETRSRAAVDLDTYVVLERHLGTFQNQNRKRLITVVLSAAGILGFLYLAIA
jgi:hypothetical protein